MFLWSPLDFFTFILFKGSNAFEDWEVPSRALSLSLLLLSKFTKSSARSKLLAYLLNSSYSYYDGEEVSFLPSKADKAPTFSAVDKVVC